jgi:hypothetical protein
MLSEPDLIVNALESIPQKAGSHFIALGGWKFNISSTVYANAKPEDVVDGWNMLNNDFPSEILTRLIQPFFVRAVLDAKYLRAGLKYQEPELVELLRFCYWYFKCSIRARNNTFLDKRDEIIKKLSDKLLSNVEVYKNTISFEEEFPSDKKEFLRKVSEKLAALKDDKPVKEEFPKYMLQLLKSVYSVTSELIFAGLCSENYGLTFEPSGGGHDYDFVIDSVPCQIKTIMPTGAFAKSNLEKIMNRITELKNGKEIQKEEVKEAIVRIRYSS